MCDVSKILDFILFANDTKISSTPKNWNFIEETLNEELSNSTDWCRGNKLSINIIKSSVIVFKPRHKREIFYSHSVGGYYRCKLKNFAFLILLFLLFLETQRPSTSPPPSEYTSVSFLFFKWIVPHFFILLVWHATATTKIFQISWARDHLTPRFKHRFHLARITT